MNEIILNSDICTGLFKCFVKWAAVLFQDVACWVSAVGLRGGKAVAAYVTSWAAGTALDRVWRRAIYIFIYICVYLF